MEEIQDVNNLEQPSFPSCSKCNTTMDREQIYCSNCGYPEKGTVSEKAKFNSDEVLARYKAAEAPRQIKSARNTLFVIAGLAFLTGLFFYGIADDMATLIAGGILAIVYLVLGYWSQQKPLIALVLGLLVYVTNMVINAIIEPETIYKGIIIKVVIIAFLIKGINSAMELRKSMR